jgi:SWI/SNF-related matrix-associated actin-dependent regulator 1 of chromatin subfamily A
VDLRIELTGTPVLNAPHELIPQLDILGVLDQFGGRKAFCDRYCPVWEMPIKIQRRGKEIEIKIEKHGARNLDELNRRLREVCMIRREKSEVLSELPAKTRATLWVPGSKPEMKGYRALERENTTPAVKLTWLRHQLGLAKVRDALDWLEDHPEPVVVWVHHRDVASAMLDVLRCPAIRGQMPASERQAAVDAFQRGDASRIVCSIQAASTGYTLTAATNALFVEQAWTPATLEQAEDRLHRIGQHRAVVSWYMAVPDTMDEHVFRLLRRKAAVVGEVTRSIELELIRVLEAA